MGRVPGGTFGAVAFHVYRPTAPSGTVFVVHGLFDHAGLWGHYLRWGLARNLAMVLVDLPGHGLSDGPRVHVDDFADYVSSLRAVADTLDDLPRPRVGLGHSTGCAALMEAVHGDALLLDDLWLLAPLIRAGAHRAGRWLLPALSLVRRHLPRGDYGNTLDPAFNAFRNADPLQPPTLPLSWLRAMRRWSDAFVDRPRHALSPLMVQGDRDRTVAWRENRVHLARVFTEPDIRLVEGAGHNLMNERADLRAQVEGLFDARLGAFGG